MSWGLLRTLVTTCLDVTTSWDASPMYMRLSAALYSQSCPRCPCRRSWYISPAIVRPSLPRCPRALSRSAGARLGSVGSSANQPSINNAPVVPRTLQRASFVVQTPPLLQHGFGIRAAVISLSRPPMGSLRAFVEGIPQAALNPTKCQNEEGCASSACRMTCTYAGSLKTCLPQAAPFTKPT